MSLEWDASSGGGGKKEVMEADMGSGVPLGVVGWLLVRWAELKEWKEFVPLSGGGAR